MLTAQGSQIQANIRRYHPDDSECIEFVVMSVMQEWGFLPSVRDMQELEALQTEQHFDAFFVAEDHIMGIVGCAGITRLNNDTCELRKIYLLKRFRGNAVGRQLLNACVAEAVRRGYRFMRLEVNPGMAQHAKFYLKNGFILQPEEKPLHTPAATDVFYKPLFRVFSPRFRIDYQQTPGSLNQPDS